VDPFRQQLDTSIYGSDCDATAATVILGFDEGTRVAPVWFDLAISYCIARQRQALAIA
jgi:hypothetical protein